MKKRVKRPSLSRFSQISGYRKTDDKRNIGTKPRICSVEKVESCSGDQPQVNTQVNIALCSRGVLWTEQIQWEKYQEKKNKYPQYLGADASATTDFTYTHLHRNRGDLATGMRRKNHKTRGKWRKWREKEKNQEVSRALEMRRKQQTRATREREKGSDGWWLEEIKDLWPHNCRWVNVPRS